MAADAVFCTIWIPALSRLATGAFDGGRSVHAGPHVAAAISTAECGSHRDTLASSEPQGDFT
jgi:hypothetical protein